MQVCERELIERERKAAERRLKSARFPAEKTLAEFDFAARPSVNKPLVLDLIRGDYLGRWENVLFVGPSGTGKTHLATSLAMAACAHGRRVRFWRVTELITTLREADQDRRLLRLRQQLGKLDLLAAPAPHRSGGCVRRSVSAPLQLFSVSPCRQCYHKNRYLSGPMWVRPGPPTCARL